MWSNFYTAGGWGMHPTSLFGFLLLAASALYALRPDERFSKLVVPLGFVTFASGLLGTSVGVCNSLHYITQVDRAEQLQTMALGCEESLHVLVLALMLIVVAGIISSVGLLRRSGGATPARD
jgi:uncharacterized membrane protein YoaK (UPF0700 family)